MKRILWIDVLKGLGIIFVIVGHAEIPSVLSHFLYSFHMPLFFLISGLTLKNKNEIKFSKVIVSEGKKLLLPYLFFLLLSYIYAVIIRDYFFNQYNNIDFISPIFNPDLLNVALWFLPCLFITKTISLLILRIIKTKKALLVVLIIAFIFISLLSIDLVDSSDFRLFTAAFWGVCYSLTTYIITASNIEKYWRDLTGIKKVVLQLLLVVLIISFYFLNPRVDMRSGIYGNPIIFIINAFLISSLLFIFSQNIENGRILRLLGKYSLFIMGTHIIILGLFIKIIQIVNGDLNIFINSGISIIATILAYVLMLWIWEIKTVLRKSALLK